MKKYDKIGGKKMGRYVTGDWNWKFDLGEQGSTFGMIMEQICLKCEQCICKRYEPTNYMGEVSERVELSIDNPEEFIRTCREFLGNFKRKSPEDRNSNRLGELVFEEGYWDKLMIRAFLKDMKEELYYGEPLNFFVEY